MLPVSVYVSTLLRDNSSVARAVMWDGGWWCEDGVMDLDLSLDGGVEVLSGWGGGGLWDLC
jgi:hypothetical protein